MNKYVNYIMTPLFILVLLLLVSLAILVAVIPAQAQSTDSFILACSVDDDESTFVRTEYTPFGTFYNYQNNDCSGTYNAYVAGGIYNFTQKKVTGSLLYEITCGSGDYDQNAIITKTLSTNTFTVHVLALPVQNGCVFKTH